MIALAPPAPLAARLRHLFPLRQLNPLRIVPLLVLVHVLSSTADNGILRALLVVLLVSGIAFRRFLRTSAFWYLVATGLGTSVYLTWETADNHRYLFVYFSLALCCVFSLPRKEQPAALAHSARLLIALCMLWATFWKLISPDYLDGSFFRYELLLDERFAWFTSSASVVSLAELAQNRELRSSLIDGHLQGLDLRSITLASSPAIAPLASLLTWWTVGIEGALSALFLLPARSRLSSLRHPLLLLFGLTTYALAPVQGFGGILMLLGLAQCLRQQQQRLGYAYVAAFLAIQLYTIPIGSIAQWVLGG